MLNNKLSEKGRLGTFVKPPPSGDISLAAYKIGIIVGHTNRQNVGLKCDWLVES